MTPKIVKRLPKGVIAKETPNGTLYFTDKYYYEKGFSQYYGEMVYFRYSRIK